MLINAKRCGSTTNGHRTFQIAFSTVVQPDALPQIQRFVVNDMRDKCRIHRTGFIQTRSVERL
ncbi:hypothetical protein D3C81_2110270 [compost metagenome]